MDNNNESVQLLKELLEETKEEKKYLKKQLRTTWIICIVMTVIAAAVFIFLFTLLPKLTVALDNLNVLETDLQTITAELKEADISGTVTSVQSLAESTSKLVNDCSESLTEAIAKLNSFDVEGLNRAIEDLTSVVEPLAKLFGKK